MVYFLFNVYEEIKKARDLYSVYGNRILEDSHCSGLLVEYQRAIKDSWQIMKASGVIDLCSACADKKTGGCCYYGVETWYSSTVLLINILLDVEIPSHAFDFDPSEVIMNKLRINEEKYPVEKSKGSADKYTAF